MQFLLFKLTFKCKNVVSFRGASPHDPPTRGFAPGSHWGHSPQAPITGLRYRARHGLVPHFKNLVAPLLRPEV